MLPFTATQEINFCGLLCLLLFAYDKSLQKVWVPLRKCPFGYCSLRGALHCRVTYFGGNLAYTSIFKHSSAVNQQRYFGSIAFNSPSKRSSRKTYLLWGREKESQKASYRPLLPWPSAFKEVRSHGKPLTFIVTAQCGPSWPGPYFKVRKNHCHQLIDLLHNTGHKTLAGNSCI